MGFTIDIDTGGTFTDGFFTGQGKYECVKVDTTPHDLTVCFFNCIEEGSLRFGLNSVEDFLRETEVVRFSTTVGTNSLIQRTGPKLGLLVSLGHEKNLYHDEQGAKALSTIVSQEMIIGIDEQIDSEGRIAVSLKEEQVKAAVKNLLEQGARIIVVSLKHAHLNPIHENQVKQIIESDYPKHYLGAVPVLLANQLCNRPQESLRTSTALLNAYLHRDMVKYLYKADDGLRSKGANRPLLIAHATGGTARVAKTKALDTYNSGPVAGLLGSLHLGSKLYNINNIISFDVGGTTTDLGLICNSQYEYNLNPKIEEIEIAAPLIQVNSIGVAGGSIARVHQGELQVGPESAGAMPGPVCYDLGQGEPTVTDACLVSGYIDPDNFLGGKRKLNFEGAFQAVNEFIAEPLNISVDEAAFSIKQKEEQLIAGSIAKILAKNEKSVNDFVLFSFGGAGGLFCCGVAELLGIRKVYTFPFSSVFSAFGSSTLDVMHAYVQMVNITFTPGEKQDEPYKIFNDVINGLKQRLERDMRGEGFADNIRYSLELEMEKSDAEKKLVYKSPLIMQADQNLDSIWRDISKNSLFSDQGSRELAIASVRLIATAGVPHFSFDQFPLAGSDCKVERSKKVFWANGFQDTAIYYRKSLLPGIELNGPAIIEAEDSTYVVPANWCYRVDQFGNGVINREKS